MKILSRLQNAWSGFRAGLGVELADYDDYWFQPRGFDTSSGARVSPETAMRLAAVFACVRVISETIGSLPLVIYRRRSDGGKERADEHPLYEVLQRPNLWQTSFEFWEMMQGHLELRGNAFAQIVSGNGRAIDQLVPLHPDRVRVFRLPSGKLRYEVVSYYDASIEKLTQEEIFHMRGLSSDGIIGMSTISAGAEVIGVGLAQQEHRARSFKNRAIPGLYLKPAAKIDKVQRDELADSIQKGFSGANAFKAFVGQPGMDITQLGISNRDAQLIEAGQATRTDIASMFRLPPHKIGDLTRGTFSNIEEQNIEFATDSIRPRVERIERRIDIDLIQPLTDGIGGASREFFAAFDMDALFRGDMKSRYEAYQRSVGGPWMSMNEARASEGKNPVDGGDDILRPVNMTPADEAPNDGENADTQRQVDDSGSAGSDPSGDPADASAVRMKQLAAVNVGRLVRKEVKSLAHIAAKNSNDEEAFAREIKAFYEGHAQLISESLVIPIESAKAYTFFQQEHFIIGCCRMDAAIKNIETKSPKTLLDMAIGSAQELNA